MLLFLLKIIHLGADRSSSEFWQITEEEYFAIVEDEEASEEDYQIALAEFGVKV